MSFAQLCAAFLSVIWLNDIIPNIIWLSAFSSQWNSVECCLVVALLNAALLKSILISVILMIVTQLSSIC
jgi:hypothetical protein